MPFYRIAGSMVHLKLSGKAAKNPPAPCCARITFENPLVPSIRCGAISSFLCDFAVVGGKTCDAPLCADHATEVGKDRHYCPRHVEHEKGRPQAA